ncbi:hypothetical protein B0H13DRAFT_2659870 [Mycena leptocephala]|nr:hypothetical protein B0H13DRAFT_2659870 [Mycena leptocephala]
MSILVEGLAAHSVSHSSIPCSVLSAGFHARLPTRPGTLQLLITTSTGAHHPISFPLAFTVSAHASSDVELGLDWTVFLRDSLIGLGYRVDSTFNAWRFLTAPTHPPLPWNNCHQYHAALKQADSPLRITRRKIRTFLDLRLGTYYLLTLKITLKL